MCVEDLPPRRIDFKVTRHSQDATPTNYDYNYNPIHRARTAQRSRLPSSYYKLFDSPHFRNEKKKTGRPALPAFDFEFVSSSVHPSLTIPIESRRKVKPRPPKSGRVRVQPVKVSCQCLCVDRKISYYILLRPSPPDDINPKRGGSFAGCQSPQCGRPVHLCRAPPLRRVRWWCS